MTHYVKLSRSEGVIPRFTVSVPHSWYFLPGTINTYLKVLIATPAAGIWKQVPKLILIISFLSGVAVNVVVLGRMPTGC